jgi:hypothetical protein
MFSTYLGSLFPLIAVIYIAIIVYAIILATRLVRAEEKIADNITSSKQ